MPPVALRFIVAVVRSYRFLLISHSFLQICLLFSNYFSLVDYPPLGIVSLSEPGRASFAIYNYNDNPDQPSLISGTKFSFLAADDIASKKNVVAGVISSCGNAINEIFGLQSGFSVTKDWVGGKTAYAVSFEVEVNSK